VACGNTITRAGVLPHTAALKWRSKLHLVRFVALFMLVSPFMNSQCGAIFAVPIAVRVGFGG
jgi:ABC-type phosphate transport system permease subunit